MIARNVSLATYNTFGIEANALAFAKINTVAEGIKILQDNATAVFILGGGSNILLTQDVNKLVLKNEIKGINIIEEKEDEVIIEVGGGENWHEFVLWAIQNQYSGVENLSLIPGTVGAAPIQNIGAYGAELKDVFHGLEALHLETLNIEIFDLKACNFGYRDSVFKRELKDKYLITKVLFRLSKKQNINIAYGDIQKILAEANIKNPTTKDVSDAIVQIRQSKLPNPKLLGNAGSFFKNPEITTAHFELLSADYPQLPSYPIDDHRVKIPAAWLIEQCGFKGLRFGNCGSHAQQALVIVNYGGATGNDIKVHAERIILAVNEKFNVKLNTEVNII